MQTFLPYADYAMSAQVLDNKRLGKQRVETLQVLKALIIPDYGWKNHPAVKMWRGHFTGLLAYQHAVCNEWANVRGYRDTCWEKSLELAEIHSQSGAVDLGTPEWLGNEELHRSHRSNLIRKSPEYYRPLFELDLSDDLPYVWPEQCVVS